MRFGCCAIRSESSTLDLQGNALTVPTPGRRCPGALTLSRSTTTINDGQRRQRHSLGLYQQPNDYSCGPFALKHALVALGRLADEDMISSVAHPHWWAGIDEVKLARAARHFECDLPMVRRRNEHSARTALTRYLTAGFPVILCVDGWGHWVTVVSHEAGRFVLIDSKHEPVLQVLSWAQLRRRWQYIEYDEWDDPQEFFDLHPVKPRFRVSANARFSLERAQFLRRPENADLAEHWDSYLGDLLEICRPRSRRAAQQLSMGEFLRRHQESLVGRLRYWHGGIERAAVQRLLRNFRFVAETYGLVIPAVGTRQALVDMSMLLAMWAAARCGVGDMYGS